jgi:hypothetical protein
LFGGLTFSCGTADLGRLWRSRCKSSFLLISIIKGCRPQMVSFRFVIFNELGRVPVCSFPVASLFTTFYCRASRLWPSAVGSSTGRHDHWGNPSGTGTSPGQDIWTGLGLAEHFSTCSFWELTSFYEGGVV